MFGTEFLTGQGLGNQLFCYVTARSIAEKNNYVFGSLGKDKFATNIHNKKGMYFMDIDLGIDLDEKICKKYYEKECRIILPNSKHDIKNGCYISGTDNEIFDLSDNSIIYGNLQSEDYFREDIPKIKKWLKIKEKYDNYRFYGEHLCVINFRGGEYVSNKELFLQKDYWEYSIAYMKSIDNEMKFVVITDDVVNAKKLFPNFDIYHFDIAGDYVAIKNSKFAIVSNSSFSYFPLMTSDVNRMIVAPKYWARYNVSDGYWASEQNIYDKFLYIDRNGDVFNSNECKIELSKYKKIKKMHYKNNKSLLWKIYCYILLIIKQLKMKLGV